MHPISNYTKRINAATKSGFEIYTTHYGNDGECTIMTNTDPKSPFNGECIDIWENGHYEQYSQFKGHPVNYRVI